MVKDDIIGVQESRRMRHNQVWEDNEENWRTLSQNSRRPSKLLRERKTILKYIIVRVLTTRDKNLKDYRGKSKYL